MAHRPRPSWLTAFGSVLAAGLVAAVTTAGVASQMRPALTSGRVSIAGTSNIHAYTASTNAVRVTRLELAESIDRSDLWTEALKPGAVQAFEVAIRAASLSSPKEGLDKNMHKALKVDDHPDILFRLARLEEQAGALRAVGTLTIAGVDREVALELKTERGDVGLVVKGEISLLMTDFGIAPPKAMLGMLKTDPKVTVSFETALAIPTT